MANDRLAPAALPEPCDHVVNIAGLFYRPLIN